MAKKIELELFASKNLVIQEKPCDCALANMEVALLRIFGTDGVPVTCYLEHEDFEAFAFPGGKGITLYDSSRVIHVKPWGERWRITSIWARAYPESAWPTQG